MGKKHKAHESESTPVKEDEIVSTEDHKENELAEESAEEETDKDGSEAETSSASSGGNWFKRCWHWIVTHKLVTIPVAVVLILAILAAIPFTRYEIAGLVFKQTFPVTVVDAETGKPVTSAIVKLDGKEVVTDSKGEASLQVPVGNTTLEVSKTYYETTNRDVLVPIKKPSGALQISLKATGRSVPVKVLNKISQKPAENITVKAGESEAKTDQSGEATLVVPADQKEVEATLSGEGLNSAQVKIQVTSEVVPENTFEVTPSGKIYFLSNQSGKIDLVKTNLDGSDRQTVLAGTGKEELGKTTLLASTDWEFLALSKRDENNQQTIFVIDTSDDSIAKIDEGDAEFTMYGWSNDILIYKKHFPSRPYWEPKKEELKSYLATSGKITNLDETSASGHMYEFYYEYFSGVSVLDNEVVYGKNVKATSLEQGQNHPITLGSIRSDGTNKKILKKWELESDQNVFDRKLQQRINGFNKLLVSSELESDHLYEYVGGRLTLVPSKKAADIQNGDYSTYLISPSGKKLFWAQHQGSGNTLFISDLMENSKQSLASGSRYQVYGWFTNDYLLVSKSSSELFLITIDGVSKDSEALRISSYQKGMIFPGYSFGYGGQ